MPALSASATPPPGGSTGAGGGAAPAPIISLTLKKCRRGFKLKRIRGKKKCVRKRK